MDVQRSDVYFKLGGITTIMETVVMMTVRRFDASAVR